MREVTPELMAALAESASSALELLEYDASIKSRLVSEGIKDAELFCDFLQKGLIRLETPEKLSPSSIATGELLELVFQIEDENKLKQELPRVQTELEQLRGSNGRKVQIADLQNLRDFFFVFAMKLDQVSGVHRKIAAEI